MKLHSSSVALTFASCLAVFAPVLVAQNTVQEVAVPNTVQLFTAVDVRLSESTASYSSPVAFNTTTLNLACSNSPISAVLSGPLMEPGGTGPQYSPSGTLQPGGNLLVDNNILVTVTPTSTGTAGAAVNVCPHLDDASGEGLYTQNCFTTNYQGPASAGSLAGQDPDTFLLPGSSQTVDAGGGVGPIDISSNLFTGSQNVTIALTDEGGWFTNSTLFLTTNCTLEGVTGPALILGNTITSTPTPQQLTQTFTFNPATNQQIGFVYDLSGAQETLTINPQGSNPQVGDSPLDPSTFQPVWAPGTSFATSKCLIHSGELLPNGNPACKLYTLECTLGTGSTASGAQCPASSVANEVVKDSFDGPAFSLQDIHTRDRRTFHEGIGYLMASEGWTGGPCTFDPAADLNLPCPQNLLISFTGPGVFSGSGETTHPNSTFMSIAQVPEDRTEVRVRDEWPDHWINRRRAKVRFHSEPPYLAGGAWIQSGNEWISLPGADNFIPSPIQGITYGISPADSVPAPADEPVLGDTTLLNTACPIPTAANPGPSRAPDFTPPEQILTFTADGRYVLHFYAQDCAGTQELKFKQVNGSWTTSFYTREINVDTVPPAITGLVLTPSPSAQGTYKVGERVKASYSCSDATSGVVLCGNSFYAPGSTFNTGTLTTQVDTRWPGTRTFTVWAVDAAGNQSSASVTYKVEGPIWW
jgi:hypothetical protein